MRRLCGIESSVIPGSRGCVASWHRGRLAGWTDGARWRAGGVGSICVGYDSSFYDMIPGSRKGGWDWDWGLGGLGMGSRERDLVEFFGHRLGGSGVHYGASARRWGRASGERARIHGALCS